MAEKKLFLLDAFALIYRAHFAFIKNPRMNSKGQNTSASFGFINTLIQLLESERPTHLAVVYDPPGPTFRHEEYPEYKANREEMPEDIRLAIPAIKDLLKACNIPCLEVAGFEADDVIGTLSHKAAGHGYKVFMVTSDKDYAQLVTDSIFLYKPSRMGNGIEIYNPAKVVEKFGVPPERIADFLGLKGDKVDNIPGIPRVGDKTAVQLITDFGSVEDIVARAEEITKKSIKASVMEHAEQGILSKHLATIKIDVEVPFDEDHLKLGGGSRDKAGELMDGLEFRRTKTRLLNTVLFGDPQVQEDLFGNVVSSSPSDEYVEQAPSEIQTIETREHEYFHITDEAALEKLIEEIKAKGEFCFDTETTSLKARQAELVAITIAVQPKQAYLIYYQEDDAFSQLAVEKLKPLMESLEITKIGQNLKYDMLVLKNYGITVAGPLFDTMLAHYVINPDRKHSMDAMARDHLNYETVSITTLIGKKGKNQLSMRDVPIEKLKTYACEDADITLELKEFMEPQLDTYEVRDVLNKVEHPLIEVLTEMEHNGIMINEDFLREYSKELEVEMAQVEKEIYKLAGEEFNINSPRQLGHIIFEKLALAKGKKTKTGQFSTREEELEKLAMKHDLPAYVLRFRKLGKLKSTYVDALPKLVYDKTGRIHSTFSQAVAATGRLASQDPNIQNIPIRTPEGREVRKAFIPKEGFTLLAADYSQVELRIMASLSEDPGMMEAFQQGQDIHRATASRVFGVPFDEVDPDMRAKAKMVNFGIIYGITAFGLAQRLGIRRGEASDIIQAYFSKYPKVKEYMDASIELAREKGYAKTIMGRRRYLPDINSANNTLKGFAERNAINTPVQGSAADLIKLAMIDIHKEMQSRNMQSRMLLQVHDELVFEAALEELDELTALIKDKMENAYPFKVPMLVEAGTGNNWLEAH